MIVSFKLAHRPEIRHEVFLDLLGEEPGDLPFRQIQILFADSVDDVDFGLGDGPVGKGEFEEIAHQVLAIAGIDFQDPFQGGLEDLLDIAFLDFLQELLGEHVEPGKDTQDVLGFVLGRLAGRIGDKEAGGGDEVGLEPVDFLGLGLVQDLHQLPHFAIGGIVLREEIQGLDPDRIHRMVVQAHALPFQEIFKVLAVLLDIRVHVQVQPLDIQARGHLEEGRYARLDVRDGQIAVAVGNEFAQLRPQPDLVLQHRRQLGVLGRIDEADEPVQFGIPVDDVPQLVPEDEAQFIGRHQFDETGIEVDDVRFLLVFGEHGKGVDLGVAGHVQIDLLPEVQLGLDLLEKVVQALHQPLFHPEAVPFHPAPEVASVLALFHLATDGIHDVPVQGAENLVPELHFLLQTPGHDIDGWHFEQLLISEFFLDGPRILRGVLDERCPGGDAGHADHEFQCEFQDVCHGTSVLVVVESAEQAVNEIIDDFADVLAGLDTPAGDLPDQGRDALRELLCDFFQEFHMPCGY